MQVALCPHREIPLITPKSSLSTLGFACILVACSSAEPAGNGGGNPGAGEMPGTGTMLMPGTGMEPPMTGGMNPGTENPPVMPGGELMPGEVGLDMPMPMMPEPTTMPEPTEPPPPVVWPNPESTTNSDPWIPENHDRITKLEPKVLLVNFDEGETGESAQAFAQTVARAFAEASRYHGFSDAAAPVFLDYKFAHFANLPNNKTRNANGNGFGFNAFVHSEAFAQLVNFRHPETNEVLTVCEMFEQGFINEAWVAEPNDDGAKLYEYLGRAQVYDDSMQPIAGQFDNCAGNGCIPNNQVTCGVSVRLMELNASRGPGCATHAQGHGIEGFVRRNVVPYLTDNARRFFNFNINQSYGTPFNDFYACDANNPPCINYVTPTHLTNGPGLPAFDIPAFGGGCGNVHFAPHSRFDYDYERQSAGVTAETSCEHYGLGDGENGQDARNLVSYETYRVNNQNQAYNDCGGGWSIYMRQNFPGYQNAAKDVQGAAMKNWWPFLYY